MCQKLYLCVCSGPRTSSYDVYPLLFPRCSLLCWAGRSPALADPCQRAPEGLPTRATEPPQNLFLFVLFFFFLQEKNELQRCLQVGHLMWIKKSARSGIPWPKLFVFSVCLVTQRLTVMLYFGLDTWTPSCCSWRWHDFCTDVKAPHPPLEPWQAPPLQETVPLPLFLEEVRWRWTWPAGWAARPLNLLFRKSSVCN